MTEAEELLHRLRRDCRQRATWLLDITTDVDIPCVAAVSVDEGGRSLACGLAARLSFAQAARAAILEMCQMELAFPLAAAKREQCGDGALHEVDRRHLARAAGIDAGLCELLHPSGAPHRDPALPPASAAEELAALRAIFAQRGIEVALVDLTRPWFGLAVVFAAAPELQLMPSERATVRLRRMQETTGGGECWTKRVPLM